MKAFVKLNQTHVLIELADGSRISVPMLPVSKLEQFNKLPKKRANAKDSSELQAVRAEMLEMAKSCLPKLYHDNLARFSMDNLAELLDYLMYGNGDNLQL